VWIYNFCNSGMLLEAQYQANTHQTTQYSVFLKDVHHEDAACWEV
jgi:hypothetical protein